MYFQLSESLLQYPQKSGRMNEPKAGGERGAAERGGRGQRRVRSIVPDLAWAGRGRKSGPEYNA